MPPLFLSLFLCLKEKESPEGSSDLNGNMEARTEYYVNNFLICKLLLSCMLIMDVINLVYIYLSNTHILCVCAHEMNKQYDTPFLPALHIML